MSFFDVVYFFGGFICLIFNFQRFFIFDSKLIDHLNTSFMLLKSRLEKCVDHKPGAQKYLFSVFYVRNFCLSMTAPLIFSNVAKLAIYQYLSFLCFSYLDNLKEIEDLIRDTPTPEPKKMPKPVEKLHKNLPREPAKKDRSEKVEKARREERSRKRDRFVKFIYFWTKFLMLTAISRIP